MAEVERIWRVTTEENGTLEVRLSAAGGQDHRVILAQVASDRTDFGWLDKETLDVEVARAVGQALIEACEVASALSPMRALE